MSEPQQALSLDNLASIEPTVGAITELIAQRRFGQANDASLLRAYNFARLAFRQSGVVLPDWSGGAFAPVIRRARMEAQAHLAGRGDTPGDRVLLANDVLDSLWQTVVICSDELQPPGQPIPSAERPHAAALAVSAVATDQALLVAHMLGLISDPGDLRAASFKAQLSGAKKGREALAAQADRWRSPLAAFVNAWLERHPGVEREKGLIARILKDFRNSENACELPTSDGPNRLVGGMVRRHFQKQ